MSWMKYPALVYLLIILLGCGATATHGSGNNEGTTPSTIAITTDRTAYAPNAPIHVTVHNALNQPIWAYDHQASCSLLSLERLVGGAWQPIDSLLAGCPLKSPTKLVIIDAQQAYQATISPGYLQPSDHQFPIGHYRLRFVYQSTATAEAATTTLYSPLFSVT